MSEMIVAIALLVQSAAISSARYKITSGLLEEHGISFAEVARNVGESTYTIFNIVKKCENYFMETTSPNAIKWVASLLVSRIVGNSRKSRYDPTHYRIHYLFLIHF